jgi:hypothetical protein
MISVVIPARDSQNTIRVTVETLYNQTRRPDEVIIVVCPGDHTCTTIEDYILSGFVKPVVTETPGDYVRDAQWKRCVGVLASKGDLVFLTDSKVVLEEHAIERSCKLMLEYNVDVVGGISPAWPDQMSNFWAKLHDKALVSNLPDFPTVGLLTERNFGKTESLPVTTALMMKRKVFQAVSGDFALEFSKVASTYDDYVLSWLIVRAGFPILVTNQVIAHHKHRISWKGYSTQISRSGQSAAVMAKMYPKCPFGTRRVRQVSLIATTLLLGLMGSIVAITVLGEQAIITGLLLSMLGYLVLGMINVVKAKEMQAFVFPILTTLLILIFSLHFAKTYTKTEQRMQEMAPYLQIH